MKQLDEERFAELVSWANTHGGSIHPDLEVYKDDMTGFSMRVKPDLKPEDVSLKPKDEILTCPIKISLSYMNATGGGPILTSASERTESTPAFPAQFMELAPHIVGRFYLIKQYLMGQSSFWYPYIATLPQPDVISSWSLPPFWPEEDAAFLEGTNTGIAAEEIRNTVKKEYKEARRVLKEADFENWQDYTRTLYNWAFSIFASRSFRPSLVIPKAVWDIEMPNAAELDNFSILMPVFDIINHSMEANIQWEVDHNSSDARVCRFQTFDAYGPGDQIFNSYGKKTNGELLLSYGFTLPVTEKIHNDYVHLRKKGGAEDRPVPGVDWATKPQDFLVSLKPMNHPSSLAGNRRQKVAGEASFDILPEFAHVEDSLIWDLCIMVIGEDNKGSFMDKILGIERTSEQAGSLEAIGRPSQEELECLRRILSASASQSLPEVVTHVVSKVKEVLLAKLGMEYDKVCETDPGAAVDEEGNEVVLEVVPETHNQQLAVLYRQQVKKVLENAIAALVPDWQAGLEDNEG